MGMDVSSVGDVRRFVFSVARVFPRTSRAFAFCLGGATLSDRSDNFIIPDPHHPTSSSIVVPSIVVSRHSLTNHFHSTSFSPPRFHSSKTPFHRRGRDGGKSLVSSQF